MTRRLTLLCLLAAFAVSAAPAQAAKAKNCPRKPNTLVKRALGRVWHKGHTLFACTTVYSHKPRAKKMGPWTKATTVVFNGVDLAWTVRVSGGYQTVDRVWAANVDSRHRWLKNRQLVPPSGAAAGRDARLQRLVIRDQSAAWVTQDGDVAMALVEPGDAPEPVGTPPIPLVAAGHRLLVGSFPDADPAALAATLRLTEGEGDGDECGGANPYLLTVEPVAGQPRLGAGWFGYWTSTNCS